MGSGINSEHILLSLSTTPSTIAYELLHDHLINIDQIRLILSLRGRETQLQAGISPYAKKVLELAAQFAFEFEHVKVDAEHLLLGIVSYPECLAFQIISRIGIDPKKIKNQILRLFEELGRLDSEAFDNNKEIPDFLMDVPMDLPAQGLPFQSFAGAMPNFSKNLNSNTPSLDYFGYNLTEEAKKNKLDPVIGRNAEIQRLIQILARRTKNNPVLVGDPGVGKTAIVEGLAQRIILGDIPQILKGKKLYQLDLPLMIAGTTFRGQFEDRLKKVVSDIKKDKNIILFIDELHTIVGAGSAEGSMDAANILKPSLGKGEIRMIGATTSEEYRKIIEKDAALERRLQKIIVSEATIDETIAILKGLKSTYEKFHNVSIAEEAITAAAIYAHRFIQDRFLPDKAIDLIDETASALQIAQIPKINFKSQWQEKINEIISQKQEAFKCKDYQKASKLRILELELLSKRPKDDTNKPPKSKVTEDSIAKIVTSWTGIPVGKILNEDRQRLINLEKTLKKNIIGQDEAIKAISSAIRRSKAGISNPSKPLASFIFLGPTGVGKTYLTQVLANTVYGSEAALIRIDMSELMEKHSLSRLLGAPPGYVGYEQAGKLTEAIRKKPFSVVLFDEMEKAHPDIFNILLQILEDGKLTDASGREVSFKHSIIIMTSNIGSARLTEQAIIGFNQNKKNEKQYEELKNSILKELNELIKPELINRLDKVLVFRPLSRNAIFKIVKKEINELCLRLKNEGYTLEISQNVYKFITQKSFNPNFGVRPLKRAIIEYLEDPLADLLLSGKLQEKSLIKADIFNSEIVFSYPKIIIKKNATRANSLR